MKYGKTIKWVRINPRSLTPARVLPTSFKTFANDEDAVAYFRERYGPLVVKTAGEGLKSEALRRFIEGDVDAMAKNGQEVGPGMLSIVMRMLCALKGGKRAEQTLNKWRLNHLPVHYDCYLSVLAVKKGVAGEKFLKRCIEEGVPKCDELYTAFLKSQKERGVTQSVKTWGRLTEGCRETEDAKITFLATARDNGEFNRAMVIAGVTKEELLCNGKMIEALGDIAGHAGEVVKLIDLWGKATGKRVEISWWIRVLKAIGRGRQKGGLQDIEDTWEKIISTGKGLPPDAYHHAMVAVLKVAEAARPTDTRPFTDLSQRIISHSAQTRSYDTRPYVSLYALYHFLSLPLPKTPPHLRPTKHLIAAYIRATPNAIRSSKLLTKPIPPVPPLKPPVKRERHPDAPPSMAPECIVKGRLPWVPGQRPRLEKC